MAFKNTRQCNYKQNNNKAETATDSRPRDDGRHKSS